MFSTGAPQAEPPEDRVERPLSTLGSLGVATLTGVIVFALGVYAVEGPGALITGRSEAAAGTGGVPTSAGVAAPASAGVAASASAGVARASPQSSSAPVVAASPASVVAGARPALPPRSRGTLKVVAVEDATVYMNGIAVGQTNRSIDVPCGQFFARLGTPVKQGVRWLGEGRTAAIPCGQVSELSF